MTVNDYIRRQILDIEAESDLSFGIEKHPVSGLVFERHLLNRGTPLLGPQRREGSFRVVMMVLVPLAMLILVGAAWSRRDADSQNRHVATVQGVESRHIGKTDGGIQSPKCEQHNFAVIIGETHELPIRILQTEVRRSQSW